jgi:hypothetical protein
MKRMLLVGTVLVGALAAPAAQADWRGRSYGHHHHHGGYSGGTVAFGALLGLGAGVALGAALAPPQYYAPPPVYYAPPPVYYAPPPVYYLPPAYLAPPPVRYEPAPIYPVAPPSSHWAPMSGRATATVLPTPPAYQVPYQGAWDMKR